MTHNGNVEPPGPTGPQPAPSAVGDRLPPRGCCPALLSRPYNLDCTTGRHGRQALQAPEGPSRVHQRRVLLAVIIAALLPASAATAANERDQTTQDGDWLWLAPPAPLVPLPNFTADPPAQTPLTTVAPAPIQVGSGEIVWKWVMPRVPSEWHVPAGTTFRAELVFMGIDRVIPIADLDDDPTQLARLEVRVDVLRLSSDTGIADGARYLEPDLPGSSGTHAIVVSATTHEDVRYGTAPGDAPLFGLKVTLTGFAQNDQPPVIVVAHPDHPTRLDAPGFPLEALRAWDHHDQTQSKCHERVLQQLSCEDDRGAQPVVPRADDAAVARVEEAAGIGVVGLMAVLVGVVLVVRKVSVSRR